MAYSSKKIEQAVEALSILPGIGSKTALRLVLHLVQQDETLTQQITDALAVMRNSIKTCSVCKNISDEELCSICSNPARRKNVICIVESIRDVMAIEETGQFNGVYHVLGGVISPIDGTGPESLEIESLVERIRTGEADELVMAISPTIEGETTMYYIARKLQNYPVQISTIARGVSFGGELEYADLFTLGRSITARVPYQQNDIHQNEKVMHSNSDLTVNREKPSAETY